MDLNKKAPEGLPQSAIDFKKADDFASVYANNVFMETSLWDLKLIFGQLDQRIGPNSVVQHTSVTLPWPQVKLLKYFLEANLIAHEIQNGRVQVQPGLISAIPDVVPKEVAALTPKAPEILAAMKAQYAAFIAANPEAAPLKE